jgi:C1q domain
MTHKFTIAFIFFLLAFTQAWAQTPNLINYQGVALNAGGTSISNQTINIRASIHDATASGTVVFSEDRTVTTDATGLFDLQIGSPGSVNNFGTLNNVAWHSSLKFLRIKMDPAGGTTFTDMGTQQLASVPYALNAKSASSLTPDAVVNLSNINTSGVATNQVLQYNGTNWSPANVNITPFNLPFVGTDANTFSFYITNTNAAGGNAIHGLSTSNGIPANGVLGKATGTNGVGVFGFATGSNGNGVIGYCDNATGTAIKATHAANGIALNATTGTGIAIKAECSGTTGATGTAVYGTSNGSAGIAIHGESINGTGMKGYGNNLGSTGVVGSSLAGTGVFATSFTGKALDVNGNVKISGGNTNPSSGAVLTSDASGNATWKKNNVSFSVNTSVNTIPEITQTKVEFSTEDHDLQSNFLNYAGSITTNSSKFTASIAGVYNFSAALEFFMLSSFDNFTSASIILVKNGVDIGRMDGVPHNAFSSSTVDLSITRSVHLNVNDKVWVMVRQANSADDSRPLNNDPRYGYFSGALLFAD